MFARNVSLSATTIQELPGQELTRTRRKMRLSDAIRSSFGKPAKREAESWIAVRGHGRWPLEGIHVDWQLEEPQAG
jgi:hypothetical protein